MLLRQKTLFIAAMISLPAVVILFSCNKSKDITPADPLAELNLPDEPFNYSNPLLPNYFHTSPFTSQDITTPSNPVTDWGATLGRVLFYDKNLSLNKTISCASCHKQNLGFSDNQAFSKGFAGGLTARNSMSLVNVRYYLNNKFFWDERAGSLAVQTLMPIQDHIEMGLTLDTLVRRLKSKSHYPVLFNRAFNSEEITSDKVANALSQFLRSIISYRSKFDKGRIQMLPSTPIAPPYPNFTPEENLGKALFFSPRTLCSTCHGFETFTAINPRNNGLEAPPIDLGVGALTSDPLQAGNFKVSSLKSVELTAPYMHNGRFATLEQVIEHYNSGVKVHPGLAITLRNPDGTPKRLNLTTEEKAALVAFLKTLTDHELSTDEKFSNPFK